MDKLFVYGIDPESIVDGPGIRYAVFTQGCSHACPGCHNPESHPHGCGQKCDVESIVDDIKAHRLIKDVTLSGGDPFEQAAVCAVLAKELHAQGYGIWAFTGFLYEDLLSWSREKAETYFAQAEDKQARIEAMSPEAVRKLLGAIDVLVDGPFVQELRSLELDWKGSSNQRVIDLAKMRQRGSMEDIILWTKNTIEIPSRPANW